MIRLDPNTLEKFRRFRKQRRAWISLWLLMGLFAFSLASELIANGTPWRVTFADRTYFPWFQHVPQDFFLQDGVQSEPDFHQLSRSDLFITNRTHRMSWSPIPYGPENTVRPEWIALPDEVVVTCARYQRVGFVQVNADFKVLRATDADWALTAQTLADRLPEPVRNALDLRFRNESAPGVSAPDDKGNFDWDLSAYDPRSRAPRSARVLVRERLADHQPMTANLAPGEAPPGWWEQLPEPTRNEARDWIEAARVAPVEPMNFVDEQGLGWQLTFTKETVQFPFRPIRGHRMGLDESGRDVFVLVLYATRISLLFGFALVISSMVIGTLIGALQGYFGGWLDLVGQRLIEIYESIPFLYVMIFLGSVFGRSFGLLLFIYAIFNWIGISYYMRAEFLKLRSQPFAEAARALGLRPGRIMLRHILPNAMVPLVTFFPFMLVGAIGSLSALDYLGFGLPAGTPSWGDLLRQAQTFRQAWWLILYPSLALFVVILLGVFIGEGLRSAFDPKQEAHWEA